MCVSPSLKLICLCMFFCVSLNYGDQCIFEHNDNRHTEFRECADSDCEAQCVTDDYCLGENLAMASGIPRLDKMSKSELPN